MEPKHFTSQAGMEAALREFCETLTEDRAGKINALCRPQFIDCDFDNKTLCLGYPVQDWMLNVADIMHGGVISTVFDLSMGLLAVYFSGGAMTPTTNMQVNFLRPVPAGQTLVVKASCDMMGKTLCAVSARAWLEGRPDKPVATASANFYAGGGGVKLF